MSRKKQGNHSFKLETIPGLSLTEVEKNISIWIEKFLSVNHPVFNNLPPCPYAKKAWQEKKVEVIICAHPEKFASPIDLEKLNTNKEVLVYVFNKEVISPDMLTTIADTFNSNYPEFVALEDHPADIETVENVTLNNGYYALILVQSRSKLNKFREILFSQGYYNNWDKEYLDSVLQK